MTGLFTLVTHAFAAGLLLGTVTRHMATLTTVIALLTSRAVTTHVSKTTTGEALGRTAATLIVSAASASTTALVSTKSSGTHAVARNVAYTSALVALAASSASSASTPAGITAVVGLSTSIGWAVARDMAGLSTSITCTTTRSTARGSRRAIASNVALFATTEASGFFAIRAVFGHVSWLVAIVTNRIGLRSRLFGSHDVINQGEWLQYLADFVDFFG